MASAPSESTATTTSSSTTSSSTSAASTTSSSFAARFGVRASEKAMGWDSEKMKREKNPELQRAYEAAGAAARQKNPSTPAVEAEMARLRVSCLATHEGAKKGRYYYMSDFGPYDSMYEDVPRCPQCETVDTATRALRDLEEQDIDRRWKARGGGVLYEGTHLRKLTQEYRDFLAEIGAERYDGCSRRTENYSGKADKSRYIGSPNQSDPHIVNAEMKDERPKGQKYWWEGTGDPLAYTADEPPIPAPVVKATLETIKQQREKAETAKQAAKEGDGKKST